MAEPKRAERAKALSLYDAGKTAQEIAEQVGVDYSTVRRWINQHKDGPGPTERSIRALVATWGELDETQAVTAELMIGHAVDADKGKESRVGAIMVAGVQARKELKVMLGELGQSSGFEELRAALLAD